MSDETGMKGAAEAVRQIFDEYAASRMAGSSERWIALWTEDGVQLLPDEPAKVGKDEILAGLNASFDMMAVADFVIGIEEVEAAGNWAYARGNYTASVVPYGEAPVPVDGKYLTIFKRQQNGAWKIHRDCFNSNVPSPEA